MKGAIVLADGVSTVSPTYAREVSSDPELGFGLEGVLRNKGSRFVGNSQRRGLHRMGPGDRPADRGQVYAGAARGQSGLPQRTAQARRRSPIATTRR